MPKVPALVAKLPVLSAAGPRSIRSSARSIARSFCVSSCCACFFAGDGGLACSGCRPSIDGDAGVTGAATARLGAGDVDEETAGVEPARRKAGGGVEDAAALPLKPSPALPRTGVAPEPDCHEARKRLVAVPGAAEAAAAGRGVPPPPARVRPSMGQAAGPPSRWALGQQSECETLPPGCHFLIWPSDVCYVTLGPDVCYATL